MLCILYTQMAPNSIRKSNQPTLYTCSQATFVGIGQNRAHSPTIDTNTYLKFIIHIIHYSTVLIHQVNVAGIRGGKRSVRHTSVALRRAARCVRGPEFGHWSRARQPRVLYAERLDRRLQVPARRRPQHQRMHRLTRSCRHSECVSFKIWNRIFASFTYSKKMCRLLSNLIDATRKGRIEYIRIGLLHFNSYKYTVL